MAALPNVSPNVKVKKQFAAPGGPHFRVLKSLTDGIALASDLLTTARFAEPEAAGVAATVVEKTVRVRGLDFAEKAPHQ